MTTYRLNLSKDGNLDTTRVNGYSLQRDGYIEVVNGINRKVMTIKDGKTFNDVPQVITDLGFVSQNEVYSFRIVDNTETDTDKMVRIYIKNLSFDFSEYYIVWKRFIINNNYAYFNFLGTNYISASLGNNYFKPIPTTRGKKYTIDNENIIEIGNAGSVTDVDIFNSNSTNNLVVDVTRNGNIIENISISPGSTKSFVYNPTFFIHADTDLNNDPDISSVNTQISTFGVNTADVVVTASEDVYSFSLSNVTYV